MRIMAIGTANSLVVHPALDERSIHVNFVLDLAIGKVRVSLQDFLLKVIAVRITGKEVCIKDSSSAVTRRTGLQLGLRILAFQFGQAVAVTTIPEQGLVMGQLDMQAARPVTGFTAHVDL